MSQRKRFTRLEMARVLMERNQYKEKLLEMEEYLKWMKMLRNKKERKLSVWERYELIWQYATFGVSFCGVRCVWAISYVIADTGFWYWGRVSDGEALYWLLTLGGVF